jgi:hypothetical protein
MMRDRRPTCDRTSNSETTGTRGVTDVLLTCPSRPFRTAYYAVRRTIRTRTPQAEATLSA